MRVSVCVINLYMKEVNDMKKNVIALALIIVMLFSLSACGSKDESPAASNASDQSVSVSDYPVVTPGAPAVPESGVTTYVSEVNGISFDYDVQYVAMTNQAGNAMIYAGESTDLPFCTVSLIPMTDAEAYLKEMAAASEVELGKDIQTKAGDPAKVDFGERDIYYIYYTYKDKDAGGTVACAYYAENLEDGSIVVYNSTALEGQTDAVNGILKLAIETFHIAADGTNV